MKKRIVHVSGYTIKYEEKILYIIFGLLTTAVNFISYIVITRLIGINYIDANIIAWLIAVSFAFITNKIFVFNSKEFGIFSIFNEATKFILSRVITGAIDVALLYLFVGVLDFYDLGSKIIIGIVVIIINYIFSKYYIFKGHTDESS